MQDTIDQIMNLLEDEGFEQGETEETPDGYEVCTWVVDKGTPNQIEVTMRALSEESQRKL